MKYFSFLTWYYQEGVGVGIKTFLALEKAVWRRFNILGLLFSLFAPWRRDIAPHDWLGFHPLRSIALFFDHLLTRFLGMVVRFITLSLGIVFSLGMGVVVASVFLGALGAPFLFFGAFLLFSFDSFFALVLLVWGVLGVLFFFSLFLERDHEVLGDRSFEAVKGSQIFPRILARLGLVRGAFPEAILESEGTFLEYLKSQGFPGAFYQQALLIEEYRIKSKRKKRQWWSEENLSKVSRIGKYWKYGYTPRLDRYALDLSRNDYTSYSHEDLIGRNEVLKNALIILERPTDNSVLLVGEAGVGKQTFVHYLARLIRENIFTGTFFDETRVLILDLGQAVSDAHNTGQDAEGLVRTLLSEAALAGNIILVIEHLDRFLVTDARGQNFAALFGEYLALPSLRVIATTNTAAYHLLTQEDTGVLKHMEAVTLRETDKEETLAVLLSEFESQENHQVLFSLSALESIIKNAEQIHWETPFPERAIDLAEEVLTYFRGTEEELITVTTVEGYLEQKSGVPRGTIGEAERDKLLNLETLLHARVIGQEKAVRQVAEALRKARAGFGNEKRPIGSFLFLGPTGVGKTETAKALASAYFGDEEKMIRLDMSEFQTPEAVDRLIGSAAKGLQGKLTGMVSENPYAILLLDELEKAYPPALDLFLQILDEGFVTDGFGQRINFRNVIIIATSNAGALPLRHLIDEGVGGEEIEQKVLEAIIEEGTFRPEFLNRFDGIVFFSPLENQELVQVVEIKLKNLQTRLQEDKNIHLVFAPGVAEAIVREGYQPTFGARSLNRYMDDVLEDRIAQAIIKGELVSGGTFTLTPESLSV